MLNRHSKNLRYLLSTLVGVALILVYAIPAPLAQTGQADLVTAIENIAKHSIPAVVHVEVTERQEVPNPLLPFEDQPFFRYFFGNPQQMPKKLQRKIWGLGSGIIIDPEGHIITNYHVVGGAIKIEVVLADGRQFTGKSVKVIGTDPKTDLAVIQIIGKGPFPYLTFGDSNLVKVGQWVVAIGQPRGLSETVTQGIISAKHRTGISDPSSYQDYLQTDAAINPGNSGGPLMTLDGKVIGINSAIISESGGFEGLGFAIPSNIAAHISHELIKNGKVVRGWLGVTLQNITPELAKSFGLSKIRGALVADVIKGSPADRAGIKRGDIIIAYQGESVNNPSILRNDVSLATPGSSATLTIIRNGAKKEITVKLGNLAQQEKAISESLQREFGITVTPVTPREANRYGLSSPSGLTITEVEPDSAFGRAGFEKGDIILEVDKNPVSDPDTLFLLLSSLKKQHEVSVLAVDHRSGQTYNVQIKLS